MKYKLCVCWSQFLFGVCWYDDEMCRFMDMRWELWLHCGPLTLRLWRNNQDVS